MVLKSYQFADLAEDISSSFSKVKSSLIVNEGDLAVIDQGEKEVAGYVTRKNHKTGPLPAIIFGDHTKKFKYVDFPFIRGADGVKVLSPKTELVDPLYFFYLLKNISFPDAGYSRYFKYIKNRTFKIPESLEYQEKAATLLSRVERLIEQREESLALLDELGRSVFLEMFGDPRLNDRGWETERLGKLGDWKSGGTPSRKQTTYFQGEIPWVTSRELEDIYISTSVEKITNSAIKESNAKLIEVGSLLLGMYDTAALKSSINTMPLACNQAIAYSKLNEEKCITEYVYFLIQIGKDFFRRQQRGVRQKNMNLTMVKNISIMLPSLPEQIKFKKIIGRIQNTKSIYIDSFELLKTMYQSLSHRAFRGELDLSKMNIEMPSEAPTEPVSEPSLKSKVEEFANIISMVAPFFTPILSAGKSIAQALGNEEVKQSLSRAKQASENEQLRDSVIRAKQALDDDQMKENLLKIRQAIKDWLKPLEQGASFEELKPIYEENELFYEMLSDMIKDFLRGEYGDLALEQYFDDEEGKIKLRFREVS